MDNETPTHRSRKKLVIGAVVTTIAVAGVTAAFVLPAEFGVDPTGIGKLTGLTRFAEPPTNPELERGAKRTGVLKLLDTVPAPEPGMRDRWEFELEPYEAVEFKYTIPEGSPMVFTWQSSQPLYYDMHAHPFDGGTELTESYGVGEAAVMHGRYIAPFTGIHGWYWQNRTLEPTRLSLEATGGITSSTVFDATGEHERPLTLAGE